MLTRFLNPVISLGRTRGYMIRWSYPEGQRVSEVPAAEDEPVWSKNSNGLKWRGLGFCTGSLFERTSPTQKQRLQSRFHEVID